MLKIAFVCTGNTCRSPMAQAMMERLLSDTGISDALVTSGGTSVVSSQPASENAVLAAAEEGLDLSGHTSRHMMEACDGADWIFGMTRAHCEIMRLAMPEKEGRIFPLDGDNDICDPFGGSLDDYRAALAQIKAAEKRIIRKYF